MPVTLTMPATVTAPTMVIAPFTYKPVLLNRPAHTIGLLYRFIEEALVPVKHSFLSVAAAVVGVFCYKGAVVLQCFFLEDEIGVGEDLPVLLVEDSPVLGGLRIRCADIHDGFGVFVTVKVRIVDVLDDKIVGGVFVDDALLKKIADVMVPGSFSQTSVGQTVKLLPGLFWISWNQSGSS